MQEFLSFMVIGFTAQLIDSALGMGFGVISASVLVAQGFHPALVSASVNAAKLPTTGTAALSHLWHGNVDSRIVYAVAGFGAIGGVIGSLMLTSLNVYALKALVTAYLFLLGGIIIWRGLKGFAPKLLPTGYNKLIGLCGGLVEGIGGSWGPIVTTSLVGSGTQSRFAIGSSNFAEFIVSVSVFTAFLVAYLTGYWEGGSEWYTMFIPVAGLIAGGLPAAIFGGLISKSTPHRMLTVAVGALAIGIACYRLASA
jgi:uncharacterized protein